MWSHERTLKLAFATGTMGLFLIAPASPTAPWLVLLVLLLPLALYLVGRALHDEGDGEARLRAGRRAMRWAGALYIAWLAVLVWRAVALGAPFLFTGLVFGAGGLYPALDALRPRPR